MSARDDFKTTVSIQLLVKQGEAVGLTDERDLGWTRGYDIVDTSVPIYLSGVETLQGLESTEQYISQPLSDRPDLISSASYDTALFGWALKLANNLPMNQDFNTSKVIKVPKKSDIETTFLISGGFK